MKWVWRTFNLTNVELNMRCKCLRSFIPHVGKVFVTYILHDRKSCDDSCATWVSHKSKEVWGSFLKLSQQFSCTTIVSCWIVTWKESKDKKKVVYEPRLQAWLEKYSKMKNLMSSWKCNKSRTLRSSWKRNEEMVLPLFCMTWLYE